MASEPDEPWRRLLTAEATIGLGLHRFSAEARDGDRPSIRLLISHATGFHAHCYRPLAEHLPKDWYIVGIDHRGHGYSAPVPPIDAVEPTVEVVPWAPFGADTVSAASWLNEDGGTGIVGFGHSMGGASLLLAAAARPDLFRQLILFEPIAPHGVDRDSGPSTLATGARRRRRTFDSFDAAIANYSAKPPLNLMTDEALREYVHHGFASTAEGVTLRCTPEFESATFTGAVTNGVWECLTDVITPTIVMAGAPDGIPAELAPQIADRLPNAEFISFPDQTHFGPLSHPVAIAEAIIGTVGAP